MTWRKRDTDYETNPQIVAAGPDAAHVFDVLLGIHGRWPNDGLLTVPYASIKTISGRLGVHRMPRGRIAAALAACEREGLLKLEDSGAIRILGWGPKWATRYLAEVPASEQDAPMTDAERARRYRTRRHGDRHESVTETVTDRHEDRHGKRHEGSVTIVTPRHAIARASDPEEGKRSEENREDQKLRDACMPSEAPPSSRTDPEESQGLRDSYQRTEASGADASDASASAAKKPRDLAALCDEFGALVKQNRARNRTGRSTK